jgi:hypothetical protein
MKNLMNRAKFVCGGEEGASNMEIIVWIGVVLVIASALFLFKDNILNFLTGAGASVNGLDTGINNQ